MFISILFVGVALLIAGTSALGIFISRKKKSVKNFTSKTSTLIFVTILTILAFFFTYANTKDIAYAVGGAFGYVFIWSVPCAVLGILFMNKFKLNKKEFWTSWFFSLTWIFLILITQEILKI
tara:strand:+ start:225 stop:590 length:366 start_codon:yes stop_codon:yes gene_type:complete